MLAPLLLLAVLGDPDPRTQQGRVAEAVRLGPEQSIHLDGHLDEAAWRAAPSIGEFVQQEPVEGGPPTERTDVRIVYDADALYIGAMLYDSDPSGIKAHQRARDVGLGTDDRFMWVLDTFRDGRTGYFFETNPAGLMGEGLIQGSGGGVNKAWDGIWEVRTQRGAEGWSVEIRIPFRTLNFDPASEAWGINFQRTVRRRSEEMLWSGHRRNEGLFNPAFAGTLTGLSGLSQGLGLEVKPYALAAAREADAVAAPGWDTPMETGFDVNYSLTPGLRASFSVNTDFAEAEVDQRQVNLTRFPLRFEEQRDFFLEGSSVFGFAPNNGVEPYFSRRIGLVEGQPVPIRYGGRLAGQTGPLDLGVVHVQTGPLGDLPAERFTAARVVRRVLEQSSVGLIYTRRDAAAAPGAAHTLGADLELFTSRFLGDQNLRFQAFAIGHNDPAARPGSDWADRSARGVRLTYPNDVWNGHVSFRQLGTDFDPAVGFTPRRGFRRVNPNLDWRPRPAWLPGVRQLDLGVYVEYLTDLDSRLATRQVSLRPLGVLFESSDRVMLSRENYFERIDHDFWLHPDTAVGAVIRPGGYAFGGWQLVVETARRRPVSGNFTASTGSFWSGERLLGSADVQVRPLPGLSVFTYLERNRIELPTGTFDTDLVRLGGDWHFDPFTSLSSSVQYDNISETMGLYTRLHWMPRPGSDVYLVYTHNWNDYTGAWRTGQRGLTSKIGYTHRF